MAQIHRTLWFRFLLLILLSSMAWAQLPVAEDTFVASGTTTPSGTNTNLQVIASPINAALVRFDLSGVPAGTTGNQVTKATVKLYVNTVSLSGSLDVCQVTSPWTEASTIFTSKPTLSATPLATVVPVSTASKYIVVDITTAVKAWQNGTANNGIALLPSSATPCNSSTYGAPNTSISVKFDAKENISASHDAGLNVVLSLTNGTVTSVGTGEGLTGGPITTSGTISMVPPSGNIALGGVKGPNATATCAAGSHFSGIAMDGTLTCTPDSAATSLSFSAITTGTNTGQALIVGSSSSLSPSGGTITANMLTSGTYPISITGSAGSAATATSAGTATNFSGPLTGDVTGNQNSTVVSAIGGAAPSLFARRDQANTFTATQALAPKGNTSQPSNLLQLNATDASSNSLSAQLQALNDGSLSFQFGPTGSAVQKLFIDNTGKITFAAGQTFPGTQSLSAGTGIAINSNAIDNTGVLSFNGRNGSVSPIAGDYSFPQISGAITSGQASPGLYAIDISGNANTATTAGSAGTAGTAGFATSAGDTSNLGGQPAANYARLDIGNNFTGNQSIAGNTTITGNATVTGNATITGSETVNGALSLPATGSGPSASQPLDLAGADGSNQATLFRWQVNNAGKLDLLTATGGGSALPSGLLIGSDGKITFAANQTFPGTQGSLTPGTGIDVTGNTVSNTGVLSFNGRNGSVTASSGDYSFPQISGAVTPGQVSNGMYGIDISGNANTATTAGSAGTAATAADASNLGGVAAANYARRDTANSFTADQTVAGFVNATSSTGDAVVGTSTNNAGVSGHGGNGVAGTANGSNGSIGVRGDASVVDGLIHYGVEGVAADTNSIAGVFDHTGGGKILSGRNNGNEVFSVDGNGKITGDGSGLTGVQASTLSPSATIQGSQVSGNISGNATSITGSINGSQVNGNIAGNATSITGSITGGQVSSPVANAVLAATATNALALGNETPDTTAAANTIAARDGSGDLYANLFHGDGSTLANTNATQLGGVAATNFARRDQANTFSGTQALAALSGGGAQASNLLRLNATDGTTPQSAQLQARTDGGLSFQFGPTAGPFAEKLSIDNTGKITFAAEQTFPGTQNLTAGTGISIVSNAINNTGVTSLTGTAGQITASSSTGAVTLSLPSTVAVNISGNAATATTASTAGSAGTATTAGTANNVTFTGITGGTNTSAAMVVGSGASLSATGTGTINATQVGGLQIVKLTQSLTPAANNGSNENTAGHCVEQQFTITGLQAADVILSVNAPGANTGDIGIAGWRNTGGGTPKLAINFCNPSSVPSTPASGNYIVVVLR